MTLPTRDGEPAPRQLPLGLRHTAGDDPRRFPDRRRQPAGDRADRPLAGLAGAGGAARRARRLRKVAPRGDLARGERRRDRGGRTSASATWRDWSAPGRWRSRTSTPPIDEAALFHLINLARERTAPLLLTSRVPPAALADRAARSCVPPARGPSGRARRARRRAAPARAGQAVRRPSARGRSVGRRLPLWCAWSGRSRRRTGSSTRSTARRWPRAGRSRGGSRRPSSAASPTVPTSQNSGYGCRGVAGELAKSSYFPFKAIVFLQEPRFRTLEWTRRIPPSLPTATSAATSSRSTRRSARACARTPGAVHQPRALLAAVQPRACWRRRATPTTRCSSGCASCRSRPTTSTNSSWSASPASRASSARRIAMVSDDGRSLSEQLARIGEAVSLMASEQQACWAVLTGELAAGGHRAGRSRRASMPADRDWLRAAFPRRDLSGADAARHRSRRIRSRSSPISA